MASCHEIDFENQVAFFWRGRGGRFEFRETKCKKKQSRQNSKKKLKYDEELIFGFSLAPNIDDSLRSYTGSKLNKNELRRGKIGFFTLMHTARRDIEHITKKEKKEQNKKD